MELPDHSSFTLTGGEESSWPLILAMWRMFPRFLHTLDVQSSPNPGEKVSPGERIYCRILKENRREDCKRSDNEASKQCTKKPKKQQKRKRRNSSDAINPSSYQCFKTGPPHTHTHTQQRDYDDVH